MGEVRRVAIYVAVIYLGVFMTRKLSEPHHNVYDLQYQSEGPDWFSVYRQDKHQYTKLWLRYHPPIGAHVSRAGRQFRVSKALAKSIAASFRTTFLLNNDTVGSYVFLTALTDDHYEECFDAVAGIQTLFPRNRIVIYDLGLSNEVIKRIRRWCGVTYRVFNYTAYPPHVKVLKKYSWKPLILQEVAKDFGAFLWFDASTRFSTGDLRPVHQRALANGGIGFVKYAPHSNFATTYRKTYEFITTDEGRQKRVQAVSSGVVLYYNTDTMFRNVLWWWLLCALDPYCTAPIPWRPCDFKLYDRYSEYAACHRYDQSVVNLLVSNLYGYDNERYTAPLNISFVRQPTSVYKLRMC